MNRHALTHTHTHAHCIKHARAHKHRNRCRHTHKVARVALVEAVVVVRLRPLVVVCWLLTAWGLAAVVVVVVVQLLVEQAVRLLELSAVWEGMPVCRCRPRVAPFDPLR